MVRGHKRCRVIGSNADRLLEWDTNEGRDEPKKQPRDNGKNCFAVYGYCLYHSLVNTHIVNPLVVAYTHDYERRSNKKSQKRFLTAVKNKKKPATTYEAEYP